MSLVVILVAALIQPLAAPRTCFGTAVPISGLRAAELADDAADELRRFARRPAVQDRRLRFAIFAPYGFDRGITSNVAATRLRGETVRAHLVAAGIDESRIRVIQLGEQGGYPFPPRLADAERAAPLWSTPRDRWTTFASVTVELPVDDPGDCSRFTPP